MTDTHQVPYSESRTARGDDWAQHIRDLKQQIEDLSECVEVFKAFSALIQDGFKTLRLSGMREAAREELLQHCDEVIRQAEIAKARKERVVADLERQGVPG